MRRNYYDNLMRGMAALPDKKHQENPPRDVRCAINPLDHDRCAYTNSAAVRIIDLHLRVCKSPHDFHSPDLTAFSPGCSPGPSSALHPRSLPASTEADSYEAGLT